MTDHLSIHTNITESKTKWFILV